MSEVNTDLAACALAVHQAIGIWNLQAAHELSAADRAPTPGLLERRSDGLLVHQRGHLRPGRHPGPGTPAGKQLGQMVATATLWTTSDALRAIEDVQTLMNDPADAGSGTQPGQGGATAGRRPPYGARRRRQAADRDLATPPPTRRPARRADAAASAAGGCELGAPPASRRPREWRRPPPPLGPASGQELGVGVLLVCSHCRAFQKTTGTKATVATNQSTAEAICWSAAALRPPGAWWKLR